MIVGLILLIAILVFVIVGTAYGLGSAIEEKKKQERTAMEARAKAQVRIKNDWENAHKRYDIHTSLLTFDEACLEVKKLAANKLSVRLAHFIDSGLIPQNCVDTHSSLGTCCVVSNELYYDIEHASGLGYYSKVLTPRRFTDVGTTTDFSVYDCLYELNPKEVQLSSMKLSDIKLYRIEGGVHYNSNVSGGGVNMQGAMAGAILAGGAAAIIGSQIGTEIKTTTTKQDERRLMLYFEENGTLKMNYIQTDNIDKTLDALRKLIPEKEESYILAQNRLSALQN